MKKVTFTYICEFPDDFPEEKLIDTTLEIMRQAEYDDENFKIELTLPNS